MTLTYALINPVWYEESITYPDIIMGKRFQQLPDHIIVIRFQPAKVLEIAISGKYRSHGTNNGFLFREIRLSK